MWINYISITVRNMVLLETCWCIAIWNSWMQTKGSPNSFHLRTVNFKSTVKKIHMRFLPLWSFILSYEKRYSCQWIQLAQLFLVFENGSFEVQHRKKTKIGEIHIRFSKNHKVSPDSSHVSKSGRITRSEGGERWLQSLDKF